MKQIKCIFFFLQRAFINKVMTISIVTVTYNNENGLNETISSIIDQRFNGFEFIIIDGNSNDNSVKLIKKNVRYIDFWVSERDNGIYDAMNKGVKMATGEWIIFMNAGDIFANKDVLNRIAPFLNNAKYDLIFGDNYLKYPKFSSIKKHNKAGEVINLWKGTQFSHQSLFTRRNILLEHPFLYIEYPIAADAEFFNWAFNNQKKFYKVNFPISITCADGISDMKRVRSKKEHIRIVRKYYYSYQVLYNYIVLMKIYIKEHLKLLLPSFIKKHIYEIKNR